MSKSLRPTVTRAALPTIALAAALAGSPLLAAPASAAPGDGVPTATFKDDGTGLTNVLPDKDGKRWPAGTTILTVDGKSVEVYCIEFNNFAVEKTGTYRTQTWAASGVKNLAKAADVAARHSAIGTPMTDAKWEKAATQVAIWHFTDNVGWDKTGSAKFTARVDQLIKGAKAAAEPATSFKLSGTSAVSGEGDDGKNVISAKLTTTSGAPLSGQTLTFVVDGKETLAKTGTDGVATHEVKAGERNAKILFTGTLPAGTVFTPESGKQAMISEGPVTVSRSASLMLAAAPAPKPTVTPTATKTPEGTPTPTKTAVVPKPTVKPTPTVDTPKPITTVKPDPKPEPKPETKPEKLPHTGGSAQWWMLAGTAALAGSGWFGYRRFTRR